MINLNVFSFFKYLANTAFAQLYFAIGNELPGLLMLTLLYSTVRAPVTQLMTLQ